MSDSIIPQLFPGTGCSGWRRLSTRDCSSKLDILRTVRGCVWKPDIQAADRLLCILLANIAAMVTAVERVTGIWQHTIGTRLEMYLHTYARLLHAGTAAALSTVGTYNE